MLFDDRFKETDCVSAGDRSKSSKSFVDYFLMLFITRYFNTLLAGQCRSVFVGASRINVQIARSHNGVIGCPVSANHLLRILGVWLNYQDFLSQCQCTERTLKQIYSDHLKYSSESRYGLRARSKFELNIHSVGTEWWYFHYRFE